ncbi:PilZ domain-containing protein [Kaarinaea lacus]
MGSAALSHSNLSGIDERNQERWLLVNNLRVFNAETNEILGHLVNVTTEGIMLISETPLAVDMEFQLKMAIPMDGNKAEIELDARSIWTKADDDPHFYKSGLQFTLCSEESIQAITVLIEKLQQLQTSKYNPPDIDPHSQDWPVE